MLALSLVLAVAARQRPVDPVFSSAIAVWQMDRLTDAKGQNPLRIAGSVRTGVPLTGAERARSLAAGSDGVVAELDGGYLDAGQGNGGALNPAGSALTVAVRLRSPSGAWGKPIFSKHGGHDRLVYNLFSFDWAMGFELGTQGKAGMTQVLAPLSRIGAADWHVVICRYDGHVLRMYVDGAPMDEAEVSGPLRSGSDVPALIGAEMNGSVNAAWKGQIDYVALWDRALAGAEIERLSGGAAAVARNTRRYREEWLLPPAADLYREALRPQFHFTARQWSIRKLNPGMREEGWLNDPNGLIYLNGEYHLFAQRWNRCWIHAVSRDLVHWKELQPAFWEDRRFGGGVQSGGAVLDRQNTSGLGKDPRHPPLVAFWSGNDNRSQCISYSLDEGRKWMKYAGNPVLVHAERDPKVVWYAPGQFWVMVMYGEGSYHIFRSPDLLHWTGPLSSVADSFECPDLFQLPIDGDMRRMKWVLVRGNGKYSVGEFDGERFKAETTQLACDLGPNFYATQSWGDITGAPGRRVQIAWMRGGQYPGMPFNQQMTFPCDLSLRSTQAGLRLFRTPAREIEQIHGKPKRWKDARLRSGETIALPSTELAHIVARVEVPEGGALTFHLRGFELVLRAGSVTANGRVTPVPNGVRSIEILLDRTSVETFINDGEISISACYLAKGAVMSVQASSGTVGIGSLELIPLRSIWK